MGTPTCVTSFRPPIRQSHALRDDRLAFDLPAVAPHLSPISRCLMPFRFRELLTDLDEAASGCAIASTRARARPEVLVLGQSVRGVGVGNSFALPNASMRLRTPVRRITDHLRVCGSARSALEQLVVLGDGPASTPSRAPPHALVGSWWGVPRRLVPTSAPHVRDVDHPTNAVPVRASHRVASHGLPAGSAEARL